MKAKSVRALLASVPDEALVVSQDADSGAIRSIESVEVETHFDADGSTTVFLRGAQI